MKIPFWSHGLRFTCTQCGRCCCGEPGIVYFNPEEFDRLAKAMAEKHDISREALIRDYMKPWKDSYTARDDFPDGHCIFFEKGKGCTIYELRPSQCRDFPFWRCNLESAEAWEEEAKRCPGMNHGELRSYEEIKSISQKARL